MPNQGGNGEHDKWISQDLLEMVGGRNFNGIRGFIRVDGKASGGGLRRQCCYADRECQPNPGR